MNLTKPMRSILAQVGRKTQTRRGTLQVTNSVTYFPYQTEWDGGTKLELHMVRFRPDGSIREAHPIVPRDPNGTTFLLGPLDLVIETGYHTGKATPVLFRHHLDFRKDLLLGTPPS